MNTTEAISFRPKIWNTDKADVVVLVTALVAMDVEREREFKCENFILQAMQVQAKKTTFLATSPC